MSRRPRIWVLALVAGAGPFSTDTYLAALPEVQRSLSTSAAAAQLTITACIVGLAVGMLFVGAVSDGVGRRGILLGSTSAYLVASLVCCVAPDVVTLIICRLLQGVASGAAASVGRAVVSDQYSGLAAARRFGTLAAIGLLAPVIAPAVGGVILQFADWRAVFVFMAGLGAVMVGAVILGIPETWQRSEATDASLRGLVHRYGALVRIPRFAVTALVQCCATAGFFAYIGGGSFVLQDGLGLDSATYATLFAVNALAMAAASFAFRFLVSRVSPERLRSIGITIAAVATAVLLVAAVSNSGPPPLALVWCCLAVAVGAMGLAQPASTVIGQESGRAHPGTASSLQSGAAFLVGAAATPLTGLIDERSLVVMSALMLVGFLCASTLIALEHAGRRRR